MNKKTSVQKTNIIKVNGYIRKYITINFEKIEKDRNHRKVLLCFPGGGETAKQFLSYTQFDMIDDPVIVFQGQPSANSFTFQNAYPWLLKSTYQNDVEFVDSVIKKHFTNNIPCILLTGKSDGAGFAVLYSTISVYSSNIQAIGICSSAHFGINNADNIGSFSFFNWFRGKDGTVIPYNILLPKRGISIFIIHGTNDTVMPYYGGKYENEHAIKRMKQTLWREIDPTIQNTYTPNINSYVQKIRENNQCSTSILTDDLHYSYNQYISNEMVINFITIDGQNHCWSGHNGSGPQSDSPSNFYLDATFLLILFFKLRIGEYKPSIDTIPLHMKNYTNNN